MAKVVVTLKIFPREISVNLNELKEKIKNVLPKNSQIYKFEEDPIAFGLIALIAHIIIPEEGGEITRVEEAVNKIFDVSQLETLMAGRVRKLKYDPYPDHFRAGKLTSVNTYQ